MPAQHSFNYAVIRVVPKVERQEFINAGVVVFCRTLDYLGVTIDYDLKRLTVLFPGANVMLIREQLKNLETVCAGGPAAGYFRQLDKSERFNWLAAPSSTIIQASPVHSGISDEPGEALACLYKFFVERG